MYRSTFPTKQTSNLPGEAELLTAANRTSIFKLLSGPGLKNLENESRLCFKKYPIVFE